MTTVVFVHGTGGRRTDGGVAVATLARGLAGTRPDVQVATCAWGAAGLGAVEPSDGLRCLLDVDSPLAPDVPWPDGVLRLSEAALWTLLYADPMAELRLLAGNNGGTSEVEHRAMLSRDPVDVPFGLTKDAFGVRVDGLCVSGAPVLTAAADLGVADVFPAACRPIRGAVPLIVDLLTRRGLDPEAVVAAVGRATVANAVFLADRRAGEAVPLHGPTRQRLLTLVTAALTGSDPLPPDAGTATPPFTAATAFGFARGFGAVRNRRMWAAPAAGFPGDVLRYLGNGAAIRAHVRESIRAATPPIVLLGHSLGSLACMDVLAAPLPPRVDLLVSVGSPVPLAYELDALPLLRRGAALPDGFPPWLNIFDTADTWGYPAEGVFGTDRVRDVEVRSGEPDGRAHASYWAQPGVLDALTRALPRG